MSKNLSSNYGQKLLDSAKNSTTDAIKTASKREIQETSEATGDLISNKIADKIRAQRSCAHKIMKLIMNEKHQKKDTYLQKKDNKLLMD